MLKVIFIGPSLDKKIIEQSCHKHNAVFLDQIDDLEEGRYNNSHLVFAPPVAGGDLFSLISKHKISLVGIVDGYFGSQRSIWHKEILFALTNNVSVLGSSSMGALRAAELAEFGMEGVGEIFQKYYDGEIESDDEVALVHGASSENYITLNEAMVNIRYTIDEAFKSKVISQNFANKFLTEAEMIFYKNRDYGFIGKRCIDKGHFERSEFDFFIEWLRYGKVDQKKNDAIKLIKYVEEGRYSAPSKALFEFNDTKAWRANLKI